MLSNSFVSYDDNKYITENVNVRMGLSQQTLRWAFNVGYCGNWHPLTWISHMLDCRLFGLNPTGHHAVNLILHIANAVLLFLVLNRMTKSLWRSAFVAALFAVHPLHVESVAWAAERKDVLSGLFWVLTMGAYALYAESPNARRYSAVVILFALGLMAKPMLVTLPIALLLLDYWPLNRLASRDPLRTNTRFRKLVLEKVPLLALAAGSSVLTFIAQRKGQAVSPLDLIPVTVRIENAIVSYASYILKMLWPRSLAPLYPHPCALLPLWQVISAALMLAVVTYLAIKARGRHPYLFVAWAWYVATLLPVIGLIQVGGQAMADRYTYIPLIGIFVMISWGAPEIADRLNVRGRRGDGATGRARHSYALAVLAAITLAVLSSLTWRQTGYWKSNLTLFRHAVDCTQKNYSMHNSLGLALADAGRIQEAVAQYEEALRIAPNYISARIDLGIALCDLGKTPEAIVQFQEAIKIDPGYADCYYSLGRALDGIGESRAAAEQYSKALKVDPHHVEANVNLGNILAKRGLFPEAIPHYRAALADNPLQAEAHVNLANALQNSGDSDGAVREYQEALRIKPGYGIAHVNLAIVLYFKKDYASAWNEVRLAESCGETSNPAFLRALAAKMPEPAR